LWRLDSAAAEQGKRSLQCLDIANKGEKPETVMEDVRSFQVTTDGNKMLIAKVNDLYVVDATAKRAAVRDRRCCRTARWSSRVGTFP
jgi:tricorn protease